MKHSQIALWLCIAVASVAQGSAAADLKRGEQLFHTCAACHSVLGDGVGPDITGIYGKPAGMIAGFNYSAAMKKSALVWNDANLKAFLKSPQTFLPGTIMTFPGYSMPADIDDVIAYLKTTK